MTTLSVRQWSRGHDVRRLEAAELAWVGAIAAGLGCNLGLHRGGRPLLCHVARNRVGFLLWAGFGLHLFAPRFDIVHLTANLYRRLTCHRS